jgi:type IV pilus assembly protein PilA
MTEPAGGFGAAEKYEDEPMPGQRRRGASTSSAIVIIGVVLLLVGVVVPGAIYGLRRYLAVAKTAEARVTLQAMAAAASARWSRDRRICPSASSPVPRDVWTIQAKKYMSLPAEWNVDRPIDAGFACLGFHMDRPQYYQYEYHATATELELTARGDLDGDGVFSLYRIRGHVEGDRLVIEPLEERDPET